MFNWESDINLISKCVSNEQNWPQMNVLPLMVVSSPILAECKKGLVTTCYKFSSMTVHLC